MSHQPIRAVAFDMDGLMFNTEDLYDQVGAILLERRGQIFTRKLKLEMMGLPGPVAFQVMRERCSLSDSVDQLQTECDEIFRSMLPDQIEMMPGLTELLGLVENLGIPKCVCTSSHREFAFESLGIFELTPRFEFVLTSQDVVKGKPDPEVYLTAAKKFGVLPKQMLVLEDSFTGSKAGAAAGAVTVAVPTEHSRQMDFSHVTMIADGLGDPRIFDLFQA